MKEADFYEKSQDNTKTTVQCHLCCHKCIIKNNKRGICHVRENRDGKLISLVYGRLVSENIDPIEKKPLFHVLPRSLSYSISTVGCNFRCKHCQNYQISQYPRIYGGEVAGSRTTPSQVVSAAAEHSCKSISYTYVEPTIFFEFAYDTAIIARDAGIKNIFVSNGYTSPEAIKKIAPFLDANNIDLKAFTEKFYREVCGAKLAPVLESIRLSKELGVWVEVTTLVIPGWNDSTEELKGIAKFLVSIDRNIPWHVTRFHPTFEMTDRNMTPADTLRKARNIGLEAGLKYVYTGNIPGEEGESTFCHKCGKKIIERTGFFAETPGLINGRCEFCKEKIAGIWE
ncbi:MAG: AmmeMemoRadiSam system radical SAM enzyme [Proteobacteria bacterium]|nr:AmmeMemoRadiSam system radical SAM enzyme [Pseudomonadota bacterium]MBU1709695.1 AmmeMemoRadiSam system radical SAM enzyme [Pseudomonadota bacterium]